MKQTLKELLILGLTPAQLLTRDSAGTVLASRFGAVSGQNITAALTSACAQAVSMGRYAVVIDVPTFSTDYRANCQGCRIIGYGATMTAGSLINTAGVDGILQRGIRQGRPSVHPTIPRDDCPKLLAGVNYFDGVNNNLTQYAIVPKAGAGYVITQLRNNLTTNGADSLGVTGSDATCWRVTGVYHAVEVLTGYLTPSASSGTWTDTSLATDVPAYTSGTVYNYKRATTSGAYLEWSVTVPKDGLLTLGILESAASSSSATLSVDGSAIDTAFTCVSSTTRRRIRRYTVTPGTHTIRITNNAAAGLNVLGLWFDELRNQRPDFPVDTYGLYRHSAQLDPLIANSANDYAIKVLNTDAGKDEYNDAVYGGSYHGGEGSIVTRCYLDGAMVNPAANGAFQPLAVGAVKVGRSLEFLQSCTVDWSSKITSGGSITVQRHLSFHLNGFSERLNVTSTGIQVSEFYGTLFGLNNGYQHIVSPDYKAIADIVDTGVEYSDRWPLGLTGEVTYSHTDTNTTPNPDVITTTRCTIRHSLQTDDEGYMGGAFVWHVPGGSGYAKYYYAPILRGKRTVKALTSINTLLAY